MKFHLSSSSAVIAASYLFVSPASAALSFLLPGYSESTYHTHSNSDHISSYDWGSDGHLYYGTATSSYNFGGIHRYNGSVTTTIQPANGDDYSAVSVVAVGSSIYFNDSTQSNTQRIYEYQIGDQTPVSINSTNYALGSDGSHLVTTGSDDWANTDLKIHTNGLTGETIKLGSVGGASGPLAFDSLGNLFYAPGFGDFRVYRWSATEVAAAISSNGAFALSANNNVWIDYSNSFTSVGGATSMLLDANGNLFITLTNFTEASSLVRFTADGSGNFDTLLTSDNRLGELRMHDGNLYLSDSNRIIVIIPEPSSALLFLTALISIITMRRRR